MVCGYPEERLEQQVQGQERESTASPSLGMDGQVRLHQISQPRESSGKGRLGQACLFHPQIMEPAQCQTLSRDQINVGHTDG